MIRPKNQTEDLIVSLSENCKTLIQQIHTKSQEKLGYKLTKPKELFSSEPSISLDGSWMIG